MITLPLIPSHQGRGIKVSVFVVVLFLFPFISIAKDYKPKGPLSVRNQNPIYLQFANINPTRPVTLEKGEMEIRIDNQYSNIFEKESSPSNSVNLDMELLRTALQLNYGFFDDMEVDLEVPFLHFDGGFLDSFIQKYHNAFGFPNGGREYVPNNEFHYNFSQGGTAIYDVPEQKFNIGDVTLALKHNFIKEEGNVPSVAWLAYFKLPTGNADKGLGSGEFDLGLGAALEKSYKRLHGYLNLGYFANGGQKYLNNYVEDFFFSYVLGGGLSVSEPVDIVVQISGGTPELKGTGLTEWDSYPMDLQLGAKGEHKIGKTFLLWQAAFTEDLNPNGPSIDFSVFGSIGVRFKI